MPDVICAGCKMKGEREREGKRGREGQKYTDTTCHHEGQIGGGRDVILHVKYSDWERNTERQRSL